nr:monocarboxylate transporter 10-like [Parasteatoda tepidariorum]
MIQLTSNDCRALIGASVINFLIAGSARLSTILFVESLTRYNASRKETSLVYVLPYLLRTLSGPLIGYFDQIFGLRKLIIAGCLVSTLSIGFCFFAEDIFTVTILWGGLFGFGYGLSHQTIPPYLNQHFFENKSTANGLALTFASLGATLLPPVMQVCINLYGLSGCFLILSAMVVHTIPAKRNIRNFPGNKIFVVFIDPVFIIMLIINGCFIFIIITIWTIILDYSLDKNLDENIKMHVVTLISVSDLISRFSSGFIIDAKYMELTKLTFISFFSTGLLLIVFVFVYNPLFLMICEFAIFFILGSTLLLTIALVPEFIEEDKRTMALTSGNLLSIPLILATPSIIGYFRGTHGSYDGVFYILGITSIFCAFSACFLPYLAKKKTRTPDLECAT